MTIESSSTAFRALFVEKRLSSLKPRQALTVSSSVPLHTVAKLMADKNVGCAPVIDLGDTIAGMISERDLLRVVASNGEKWSAVSVASVMTKPVTTLPYYASVARALHAMCVGGYRHIPVTRSGAPLSIISTTDLVKYFYLNATPLIARASTGDSVTPLPIDTFSLPLSSLSPKAAICVQKDAPLLEVVRLMASKKIGSVLVVDERSRMLGIFTERDLVRRVLASERSLVHMIVGTIMTERPHSLQIENTVALALETFAEKSYRHVPVTNENEELIGTLSVRDFVAALTRDILDELS